MSGAEKLSIRMLARTKGVKGESFFLIGRGSRKFNAYYAEDERKRIKGPEKKSVYRVNSPDTRDCSKIEVGRQL